ncbi:MAG: DUF2271 domain-containing protein [Bacteroidales bacterium]|jgi:hypothetical protein|nr:DUF2271 domain-containing protein [Bacteroidales bacterium]
MKNVVRNVLFISIFLITGHVNGTNTKEPENGKLEITVSYERQSGRGSNQYAVWIEDTEGKLIKTIFVTKFTADGGYSYRPNCVPLWLSKATPASHTKKEIDAYSGATPSTGEQIYIWDLTDNKGNKISQGEYTFFVEGTLINNSTVLYKGSFAVGKDKVSMTPTPDFNSDDPKNKGMIKSVTAKYIP